MSGSGTMSGTRAKRRRIYTLVPPSPPPVPASANGAPRPEEGQQHPALSFLRPEHASNLEVRQSESGDLTLHATRDLAPGSIVFSLPFRCVLTFDAAISTDLSALILESRAECSPEMLVWINMVFWLRTDVAKGDGDDSEGDGYGGEGGDGFDDYRKYLRSLPATAPNASSWPSRLQDALRGSNVYTVLDTSGKNDGVPGNVHVIQDTLRVLDEVRRFLLAGNERGEGGGSSGRRKRKRDGETDAAPDSYPPPSAGDGTVTARGLLTATPPASIFTRSSIAWARGHYTSRRYPEMKPSSSYFPPSHGEHTAGYGDKLSCFIPVLDLMNHSPDEGAVCTLELSALEQSGEECAVVRVGERGVEAGEELFYSYGRQSNEALLQGFGFCLDGNEEDAVSFVLRSSAAGGSRKVFSLKRGGVANIPPPFWRALSGADTDGSGGGNGGDEEGEGVEVGVEELEALKENVDRKLEALMGAPGWTVSNSNNDEEHGGNRRSEEGGGGKREEALCEERKRFVRIYLQGQKEVLQELQSDLSDMLQQCEGMEDDIVE